MSQSGCLPGHRPEIEAAILGCMQCDYKYAKLITEEITDADFTDYRARLVYREFVSAVMAGATPDASCLQEQVRSFAMDCLAQCPTAANTEWYIRELIAARVTRTALAEAQAKVMEIEAGHFKPEITERTNSCDGNQVSEQIEAEIAGKRRAIQFAEFPILSRCQALLPSTVTVLCGSPGASKSLLTVQFMAAMSCTASVLALEDDTSFHLRRLIAMESRESRLTNDQWCRCNPQQARGIVEALAARLAQVKASKLIQAPAKGERPTVDYCVSWAEGEARRGVRVVAIDPVSMVETRGNVWESHQQLVTGLKRVAEEHGCSVILVAHPKDSNGVRTLPGLENVAGGKAFQRFTHTVLWLEACHLAEAEVEKQGSEILSNGPKMVQYNRVIHLLKTRVGIGSGQRIAVFFDKDTLRHEERGVMV